MLHVTPRLQRNRLIGSEFISFARVPCTLDDRGVPVFSMRVWPAHDARRKLDVNNVDSGLGRVAFDNGLLKTQPVFFRHPLDLLGRDAHDTLCGLLAERAEGQ